MYYSNITFVKTVQPTTFVGHFFFRLKKMASICHDKQSMLVSGMRNGCWIPLSQEVSFYVNFKKTIIILQKK
jgi:hypothetical protein